MRKHLILIAGPPATGKTRLVDIIQTRVPRLLVVTPDELKEHIADSQGFNNLAEKAALETIVWNSYYAILQAYMAVGKPTILSEYPFSHKQREHLVQLCRTYDYTTITIRLVCDFDVLWERRYRRDRASDRHLSHIMTHYHDGDQLSDRDTADNHITRDAFAQIIHDRAYNDFALGTTHEVDTTNLEQINYPEIWRWLKRQMG